MESREIAIQIFEAAVAAVQPGRLIPARLFIEDGYLHILDQQFPLNNLPGIYVIGAGKASAAMAGAVEAVLGGLIKGGIIVTKDGHSLPLLNIRCIEAAHPFPDERGVAATEKTIELLKEAGDQDIIICLLSGGASALWIDVPPLASLADTMETFRLLLESGAAIHEVNTVRKHLSGIKGGQLLKFAPTARWFSLIISDVQGDDLSVIASGPTIPDPTTFNDARRILVKYGLMERLPASVARHIYNGLDGKVPETLKPGDPLFRSVLNRIIGNNKVALEAAAQVASSLGYATFTDDRLQGDAGTAGRDLIRFVNGYSGPLPACFLHGGETTVVVTGKGKGGRNQQLALSALIGMSSPVTQERFSGVTLLAAGTDGTDGPTDAAGAIADRHSLAEWNKKKLDAVRYFNDNDAYHFFEETGGLLKTGATQTNVMDLVVILAEATG